MVSSFENRFRLSGNTLKSIAALSMLIDHIGVILPEVDALRIIGRISFPIFAFMIAEGCAKARNNRRYFLSVFAMGTACQVVYYLYDGSTYSGYSHHIFDFHSLDLFLAGPEGDGVCRSGEPWAAAYRRAGLSAACDSGLSFEPIFTIDYGFWGCMIPVLASIFRKPSSLAPSHFDKLDRLGVHVTMLGIGLIILSSVRGDVQPHFLCSVPFLLLYSGIRGAWHMKLFFYIFYPAHLTAITLLSMFLA